MADDKLVDLQVRRRIYSELPDEQLDQLKSDPILQGFAESRKRLDAEDPLRPRYHFSSPEGRLNDPNGLCYWNGKYHLFYQFSPEGEPRSHWGHTVSDDLIHWSDLPVAIYPSIEYSCYSGNTCVEDDRVIAFYQGTTRGSMVATSSDPLLLNWKKHPNNPVISRVDTDDTGHPYSVGDPCIWKEEEGYFALTPSSKPDLLVSYSVITAGVFRGYIRGETAVTRSTAAATASAASATRRYFRPRRVASCSSSAFPLADQAAKTVHRQIIRGRLLAAFFCAAGDRCTTVAARQLRGRGRRTTPEPAHWHCATPGSRRACTTAHPPDQHAGGRGAPSDPPCCGYLGQVLVRLYRLIGVEQLRLHVGADDVQPVQLFLGGDLLQVTRE